MMMMICKLMNYSIANLSHLDMSIDLHAHINIFYTSAGFDVFLLDKEL